MAKHITRGSSSSVANPIIDTYTALGGILIAPQSLTFAIYDVSTPAKELAPVEVVATTPIDLGASLVSPGRYVATWTVPMLQALGRHVVMWSAVLVMGGPVVSWSYALDVISGLSMPVNDVYATVSDVRAEGVPATVSDARILEQLMLASQRLTDWTGRSFVPRYKTLTVDGQQRTALWLDEPICAIEQVRIAAWDSYIEPGEYVVYNRHLTQRMLSPDDRDFPQLAYRGRYDVDPGTRYAWASAPWLFGRPTSWGGIGRQSVAVSGVFGYTEWDGSPVGATPLLAKHATVRIALKTIGQAYKTGVVGAGGWSPGGVVTSMRTREQSINFDPPKFGSSGNAYDNKVRYTGDPITDGMIEQLCRPLFGAVV